LVKFLEKEVSHAGQGSRGREEILGFFWTKSDVCDFVLVTAAAVELYARVTQVNPNRTLTLTLTLDQIPTVDLNLALT